MALDVTRWAAKGADGKNSRDGVWRAIALHLLLFLLCCHTAEGGSRMVEPPTRSSLWRYGFGTPVNFYDDDVNCGGFQVQHINNEGMCGICGDPWNAPTPRDNEAGGTLAPNPLPVRVYKKGGFIPVAVESTSELLGKYEFRLCKLESNKETPDQHCFDQYRLSIVESEYGQSYQISQSGGLISLHLKLPEDMVCSHCLLQWRHITGFKINRQGCVQCGTEEPQCNYCKGCGDQEWYQGCADIAVIDVMGNHPAVLGVRTQQELEDKWEAFLKNCTVGGDDKKGPSSIDNKINISYILSESTSSDFASSLWQNVTDVPATKLAVTFPIAATATATVTRKIEAATTLHPSLFSSTSCAADPKSQPAAIESSPRDDKGEGHRVANAHTVLLLPTVGDSKLVPPTKTPELRLPTVVRPTANPSLIYPSTQPLETQSLHLSSELKTPPGNVETGVLKPASGVSQPVVHLHNWRDSFHNGDAGNLHGVRPQQRPPTPTTRSPPRSWKQWWNSPGQGSIPSQRCYVPYKAPWYMQSAVVWCKRNCPRRGSLCHYNICRPVSCPRLPVQAPRQPLSNISWLLSLFLDGFPENI